MNQKGDLFCKFMDTQSSRYESPYVFHCGPRVLVTVIRCVMQTGDSCQEIGIKLSKKVDLG